MQISQSIRRFLERLGPYQSLLVLAVPLAIIEPLKVLALLVVGDERLLKALGGRMQPRRRKKKPLN